MSGKVFRRCTKCLARLQPKARQCVCGSRDYSWYFVVDIARGEKRKQAKRGGFSTREDAERALNAILQSVDADAYVKPSLETVETFLTTRWLPAMRPPKLEATTWIEYRGKVNNQIVPRIGHLRLQKLQPVHLNGLYADLLENGRADGKGGLAAKTVRECHVILRKALGDAVRWGFLQRNMAALADPPSTGLPPIPMKDLRHTHASLLLAAGKHPKIVSERLGHHSVAFTMDTYAHVLPGMQGDAAEDLSDLIFGTELNEDVQQSADGDGSGNGDGSGDAV